MVELNYKEKIKKLETSLNFGIAELITVCKSLLIPILNQLVLTLPSPDVTMLTNINAIILLCKVKKSIFIMELTQAMKFLENFVL
jgi:hypothetical protein